MSLQIATLTHLPARGRRLQGPLRHALRDRREYRAARACHSPLESLGAQPFEGLGDARTKSFGNRLQVIRTKCVRVCSKA